MKLLFLSATAVASLLTLAMPTSAEAQQKNNPFARPQARLAAQASTPAPTPDVGYNPTMPQAHNPYANGGYPGQPGGLPPGAMAPTPMPTTAIPVANGPTEEVEEFQGTRIGKVNGRYVYKGTASSASYHFEPTSKHKVTRKLAIKNSGSPPSMTPEELMAAQPGSRDSLPSSVGRAGPRY